jgi:hypothetical protein
MMHVSQKWAKMILHIGLEYMNYVGFSFHLQPVASHCDVKTLQGAACCKFSNLFIYEFWGNYGSTPALK